MVDAAERHVCREGVLIETLLAVLRAVDDPDQPGETQRLADVSQIVMTTLQDFGYSNVPIDGSGTSCCDYRDHGSAECFCPDHERSDLHPLGERQ